MPAYWIARARIIDPVAYKKYAKLAPEIIGRHGGTFLARGGKCEIMEGTDRFDRFVIIEFPSIEQGLACFRSAEYQEAAAFRRDGAGEVESAMVEGVPRTA